MNMTKTEDKMMEELDNQIAYCGYTRKQLKEAFDKICSKDNWKNPIDAIIPIEDKKITQSAIIFFLADNPIIDYGKIEEKDVLLATTIRITSKGYQC